jgi:hypothetical protein
VVQTLPDDPALEGRHSAWDVDAQQICLDRTYTPAQKRGLLLHEMDHAYADWKLWVAQEIGFEVVPDAKVTDPDEREESE